ncbi:hypothetical protein ACWKT5_13500 [Streptomyces avermitilis]
MSQLLQVYQNQIAPLTRPEAFFSLLYGAHMKQFPKRSGLSRTGNQHDKNRQWVFVGNKERMKSMATQATLFAVLSDPTIDTTYYTPNGYYRRDLRLTESLRWLNAFVFDFDTYGDSIQDVFERFDRASIPRPTAVIQTPSGGYHAVIFFTVPVRATPRAIRLYTAIMWHMAVDLEADTAAVGANRIFRTPTQENLIYFDSANRYDFDVFKSWRDLNHPYDRDAAGFVNIHTGDLMSHPALQYLVHAPCQEGRREQTALTLALAMKASDWSQSQAETALRDWFISCCKKGAQAGKKPFTESDAVYKVGYVYRKPSLHAPKAEIIRELTGLPFYYQTRNAWEAAKPRCERERVHLSEWKEDLIRLLDAEKELSGTQKELAARLNCPLASFKAVLSQLQAAGTVIVETRKGRGGCTMIRLPEPPMSETVPDNVIEFPQPVIELNAPIREAVVVHADFQTRQIQRIERHGNATADDPDVPETGPPK